MKKSVIVTGFMLMALAGAAFAADGKRHVTSLGEASFVVVAERGSDSSAVEYFVIEKDRIILKDAIIVKEDRFNQSVKIFRFEKILEDINVR